MKSNVERCAEHAKFKKIDAAFRVGDLAALRAAVDDPRSVPNGPMPVAIGHCLEYAIYHSPLPFIHTLLESGADPNPADHAGFPPLIAALSCSRPRPGAPGRPDVADIIKLLLSFGANPNQRGINDYTSLHMAVSEPNLPAVEVLLEAGADPHLCTRIDDCETPREMAEAAGLCEIAELLAKHEARLGSGLPAFDPPSNVPEPNTLSLLIPAPALWRAAARRSVLCASANKRKPENLRGEGPQGPLSCCVSPAR